MSFNPEFLFDVLPKIAVAGLALIIAITVWTILRSFIPPAPGLVLGHYEIMGRYAGSKFIKRLRGILVDSTSFFLSPEIERQLAGFIEESIKRGINTTGEKNEELKKILSEFKFSDYVKIYTIRSGLSKHMLIQTGHIDKPLNNYAVHDPESKFSPLGFLSQGVITGVMVTLPVRLDVYKIGKMWVHILIPDDPLNPSAPLTLPPQDVALLVAYAPAVVEFKEIIKSKDEQIRRAETQIAELTKQIDAMATKIDAYETIIHGYTESEGKSVVQPIRKIDIVDLVIILLPAIFGFIIAESAGLTENIRLLGMIVGALIGLLVARRRW
ncbi:MAG: hypothetical protein QXU81_00110 [Candidatus Bathyarchaeia archaeon]